MLKITAQELNPKGYALSDDQAANQKTLLARINAVRDAYGKPMTTTSGVRSMDDHLRIYAAKGITDKAKIPMKSQHLKGAAVDVLDSSGALMRWCRVNEGSKAMEGLWIESETVGWVHFQCLPYGSWVPGKAAFFKP